MPRFRTFVGGIAIAVMALAGTAILPQAHSQAPPASLKADPLSFRDVVKSVLPAVVSIEAKTNGRPRGTRRSVRPGEDVPESLPKFFEDLERRQVEPTPREQRLGSGSGFIIDAKGIILTNNHVVANADTVEIELTDGRKFISKEVRGDDKTDLALVIFDPKGAKLPVVELGDSSQMEIGDRVLAVGAPFGLAGSVTHGIISAKGRDIGLNRYDDFLQTDAPINPGNSGGPLVNLEGKVIGINSAIQSRNGAFQGVSLAISSNMAKSVVQSLTKDGVVKRPFLGIEAVTAVTPEAAKVLGLSDGGVVIADVREKGPAAKAGLKADDAILSLNGKPIKVFRDLVRVLGTMPIGSAINVDVLRDRKAITLKVTLEEEPAGYGIQPQQRLTIDNEPVSVDAAGLELMTASFAPAQQRNATPHGAAIVRSVEQGSVADRCGLKEGTLIRRINRKGFETAAEAKTLLEEALNGAGALVQIRVAGGAYALVMMKK